jgi:tRNA threonylcarbamoyladenosine biosynthesis protein TsaE
MSHSGRMLVEFEADSEADTIRLASSLASLVRPSTVIGLIGDLGAGKTFLTRALAKSLGVDPAEVSSPTFVLIHEYEGTTLPVFHFDAYRLSGPSAFEALGVADYWTAGGVCLIEWADRVADLLPENAWWVRIVHAGEHRRRIAVELPEAEGATLARSLTGPNTAT